jgi:membrane fusion protein (multidrug efflux system)
MSATSATTSSPNRKTGNSDRPAAPAENAAAGAANPKPKRARRRLVILFGLGVLLLAGGTFWYLNNFGYETTDDAAIEGHVIQVSPKLSAHVKAVYFDDNYQVRKGDLLIELDPRDYEVSLASAMANLASAQSKLAEAEAQQNVAQAGLGQFKADLVSAQATADNAKADLDRNVHLFQTHVIDRREYDASLAQAKSAIANVESATKKVASQ